MKTTPEAYASLLANQRRTRRGKIVLDHVPGPQEILSLMLHDAGLPHIYDKFYFHPRRKYRVDIAVGQPPWLLIEVDGNGTGDHPGAHRSLRGYEDDRERDAEALALGYIILRVTTRQVLNGKALLWIQRLLAKKQESCRE